MTVTDEAKLFAIRQQLLEMRYKLDASINIINYVFERPSASQDQRSKGDDSGLEVLSDPAPVEPVSSSVLVELYPGQLESPPDFTDIDPEELDVSLEEIVECVE